jgi:hypothetical protein
MKPGDLVRITQKTAPQEYIGMIGLCVGVHEPVLGELLRIVLLGNGESVYILDDDVEVISDIP